MHRPGDRTIFGRSSAPLARHRKDIGLPDRIFGVPVSLGLNRVMMEYYYFIVSFCSRCFMGEMWPMRTSVQGGCDDRR